MKKIFLALPYDSFLLLFSIIVNFSFHNQKKDRPCLILEEKKAMYRCYRLQMLIDRCKPQIFLRKIYFPKIFKDIGSLLNL